MADDHWKPEIYDRHTRFVSQLSQEVISDLSPKEGERILDLGCGDGVLSEFLLNMGCHVTGIDSSASFVKAARARGVEAVLGDAQRIDYDSEFDAVFSNAALHWMPHQSELAARVFRALRPGGRFVAEMGGAGNISKLRTAMTAALAEFGIDYDSRNPWTFPSPREQRARLEKAGFRVAKSILRDRPTILPTDVRGWLMTFGQEFIADLDSASREKALDRMAEHCRPAMCDEAGKWTVDYVRLNFIAVKPAEEQISAG